MTDVRRNPGLIGGREIALAVEDNARHPLDLARGAGNQPVLVAGADPEEGE